MYLVSDNNIDMILDKLELDLGNCLYLYVDIKKYGLKNSNMKVWVDKINGVPDLIVMKYYDSMQIYLFGEYLDIDLLCKLINSEPVKMISAPEGVIKDLMNVACIRENYEATYGKVFRIHQYRKMECEDAIVRVGPESAEEIAALMCMDDIFSANYSVEKLARQMEDRLKTNMGRSYVVYKSGIMIAHIATFAEESKIAVTSGLIVHPNYREYSLGTIMESFLVNRLQQEGFQVYTLVNERKRINLLRALMCEECGQYGKLTAK